MSLKKFQTRFRAEKLCSTQNPATLSTERLFLATSEIVDIVLTNPFPVPLSSFSPCLVHVSKNDTLEYAVKLTDHVLKTKYFQTQSL